MFRNIGNGLTKKQMCTSTYTINGSGHYTPCKVQKDWKNSRRISPTTKWTMSVDIIK